jgi:hypothetical protein
MCLVYHKEWNDSRTIGIYGRFMKGKKRYFIRLLQSFPKTEKRFDLYLRFWNHRIGLTYDEIGLIMIGIRQRYDIASMLNEEEEARQY